ncbi:MAG: repressor LexA [Acidobacteriota bacterium]|nr:repressor LexA [Acidobacteriota bacterium]
MLRVPQRGRVVATQAEQVAADYGRVGGTVMGAMDEVDLLIEAIARSGVKRSWLADEVGIGKSTLSRIESGEKEIVDVRLFIRLARALGQRPSAFLGDSESPFLTWDLRTIREAVMLLYEKFVRPDPVPAEPNAQFLSGKLTRRRGVTLPPDPKRVAKRYRAAATPDRETFHDDEDAPEREIPAHYAGLGAKHVFKAEGDSMTGIGITDRDILFVRPESDPRAANGKVVVCRVAGSEYVKILKINRGRIHLLSANERYDSRVVDEEADNFELIGVVVGRSGYPAI